MKKVELIIGNGTNQISLDLEANAISIALQYSIDDIRDIDKKNSNYSKTITVPGTKKNNDAFGYLFDVNSTFDQFNPNKKVDARIVIDSSPVLEGYLQLTKVNKLNNADLQGNRISYNVIVFDDSVDFIQTLGDKEVKDLDVTDFNHTYDRATIENAWSAHTYEDLYQYPLLDKNTKGYFTTDFKPAFYHKALLLKIAEDAGYTLEGSFITGNTQYDQEIIAWDGNTPSLSDSEILSRKYKSSMSANTTNIGQYIKRGFGVLGTNISNSVNYDDITTTPLFDNTGGYVVDPSLSYWEVIDSGRYTFTFESKLRVTVENLDAVNSALLTAFDGGIINNSYAKMLVRIDLIDAVTGNVIQGGSQVADLGFFSSINPNDTEVTNADKVFTFANIKVTEGQEIYPVFTLTSNQSFGWKKGPTVFGDNQDVELRLDVFRVLSNSNLSTWSNEPALANNIQDGDLVELDLYLPKEIKQKDILSDIIRRYNVYVRKHPINTKTLILETRDDFYANDVTVLDWTQKKDYSSEDNIAFLSDLQNKEILFTYKESNDLTSADGGKYNEAYNKSTGDIYGQKKISFDNDFVQGTKKIESIFSTAPLVFRGNIGNNVVVPTVDSNESKRNPILLYWGGEIPVQDENGFTGTTLEITWGNTGSTATPYTTYPYAGHYDNPYTPTLDIHYGEITYEYYGVLLNNITDNNLFNNYWRNYINQITDGRLVTSKFYLRETDINFIKDNLNSRIFVKDSYYVINKIVDYKPLEDGLTTVELLRIEQGSTFEPVTGSTENITLFNSVDALVNTVSTVTSNSFGPFRSNSSNNVNTRNAIVVGNDNYVGADTTAIVNGDNNNVGGGTNGVSIQGNNNTVAAGADNVTIVGNDVEVNDSNTTVLGALTINADGSTQINDEPVQKTVNIALAPVDLNNLVGNLLNYTHNLSAAEVSNILSVEILIVDNLGQIVSDLSYAPSVNFTTPGGFYVINPADIGLNFNPAADYVTSTTYNAATVRIRYTYIPD